MARPLMIAPPHGAPKIARLVAAGGAGLVVAGAAWWVDHHNRATPMMAQTLAVGSATDPLATDLARCQALGEAGARDMICLQTWSQARRRFLAFGDRRAAASDPPPNPLQSQGGGD